MERCRFLEAAGCASVCMNTCKVGLSPVSSCCGVRTAIFLFVLKLLYAGRIKVFVRRQFDALVATEACGINAPVHRVVSHFLVVGLLFSPSLICHVCLQVPTEEFFMKDMGLALEMTPNYEDFSCQVCNG